MSNITLGTKVRIPLGMEGPMISGEVTRVYEGPVMYAVRDVNGNNHVCYEQEVHREHR